MLGAEVQSAEIKFTKGTYKYQFAVLINAPLAATRQVVTDYDNLKRINEDIIDSRVLERISDTALKRRLWIEYCLLVFCFDLYFVENVTMLDGDVIETRVIPEESNFKSGFAKWTLRATSPEQTTISVEANQEPSFWIPPVIGPILMRRAFLKEVKITAGNIEQAALVP